jgi:hypothetical protein
MSMERIHSIEYGIEMPEKGDVPRITKQGLANVASYCQAVTRVCKPRRYQTTDTALILVYVTHPNIGGLTKDTVEDATGCIPWLLEMCTENGRIIWRAPHCKLCGNKHLGSQYTLQLHLDLVYCAHTLVSSKFFNFNLSY